MKNTKKLMAVIAVLVAVLIGLTVFALRMNREPEDPTLQDTQPSTEQTVATEPTTDSSTEQTEATEPATEPTEPPITLQSTASIGAVGDVLMHMGVVNSGLQDDGSYNYDSIFHLLRSHIEAFDYAAANMEGTLCGTDNGYDYGGYPSFNCPDAIAEGLKTAGFDMLLTANNHTYDTRHTGFMRTQQVISDYGLAYTGTVTDTADDNFIVQEINGVKVGMICYTYNTAQSDDGTVSLNYIPLTKADSLLINSFSYSDLSGFYNRLQGQLDAMEQAGAEATVLFIHWGDEYHLQPNSSQKKIAQTLCDMGIDVIIGGHPHVVQPVELLESTTDPEHKTVCIYSLGNAVSNQRLGNISSIDTAHTEDGVLFGVTFAKYSDGTVILQSVDLTPIWVNLYKENGSRVYAILPLDTEISDWQSSFNLTDSQLAQAKDSYQRTMALVSEGLTEVQAWCENNQAAVEAALGVQ